MLAEIRLARLGQRGGLRGFARTDVWVRDVRQVIDDAIARAQPTNGKVTLVGYSLGAQHIGRTLYKANPVLPESPGRPVIAKVDRAVFLSPFFGGPTEETPPPGGFVTFPLTLNTLPGTAFNMPPGRDQACTGHVIDGTSAQLDTQIRAQDPLGANWGGAVPGQTHRSATLADVLQLRLEPRRRGATDPTHTGHAGS